MKFFSFLFSLIMALFVVGGPTLVHGSGGAPLLEPTVLAEAKHDSSRFTQALFFNGHFLYESSGLYGRSTLFKDDFTQTELSQRNLKKMELDKNLFAEGAALVDDMIYLLTWREEKGLIINPDTLTVAQEFKYKGAGWGLAYDGEIIWRSAGSAFLYPHHPKSFSSAGDPLEVVDQGRPVKYLNELEWDPETGLMLANIYGETKVAAIDLKTGHVIFWLNGKPLLERAVKAGLPPDLKGGEAVMNGLALASDGQSLWLTGKLWPRMYQIVWPPAGFHMLPENN